MPGRVVSARRWKRAESEIARALGTERLPNSGTGQPDCRCPGWAVQIKTRKELPAWLKEAMAQATRDAAPGERPVVVLNEVSQGKKPYRLAVLLFDDWQAIVTEKEI